MFRDMSQRQKRLQINNFVIPRAILKCNMSIALVCSHLSNSILQYMMFLIIYNNIIYKHILYDIAYIITKVTTDKCQLLL